MNPFKLGTILIIIALVTGCTTKTGTEQLAELTQESIGDFVQDGKTTKEEIIERFGTRYSLFEDNSGKEQWVYELSTHRPGALNFVPYVNLVAGNFKCKNYKLIVTFDENDVVVRHRFSNNEHKKTMWKQ
ncbi:MAG: hypothetical protein KDK76_07115 [Chlamydiia bacterium]|nr:hypothetical protein [Chlamydiia bacterium]